MQQQTVVIRGIATRVEERHGDPMESWFDARSTTPATAPMLDRDCRMVLAVQRLADAVMASAMSPTQRLQLEFGYHLARAERRVYRDDMGLETYFGDSVVAFFLGRKSTIEDGTRTLLEELFPQP